MDARDFADEALERLPVPFLALERVETTDGATDMRVTWANTMARDRYGDDVIGTWVDRDQLLGPTEPIVPGTGTGSAATGVRMVQRTVAVDGRTQHLRCTLIPQATGAGLMVEDVTSEVLARSELVSAGTTLARVERWGNLGVWEVDLVQGTTYWSTQVFQILGVDEVGHDRFRAVVHPDDLPLVDHVIQRMVDQPGPYRLTHRIRRHDEVRTLDQHVQAVAGPDGRPVRLIGTMIDVTANHALQHQVRAAQNMRSLGMLAGGLAHDFNNVLMIVRGHAELLLSQLGPDDEIRPNLEAIHRAGERASTLTRKLMALGRQEELRPAPLRPGPALQELAQLVGPAVAPAVRVSVEVTPVAESAELHADVDQLNQVLIDLVLNARDAGAGAVRLRADVEDVRFGDPRIADAGLPPAAYGLVQVVDDGEGMDDETRARVFEPFFTTKESAAGSGLGLANARSFAQRSGGTLWVDSELGVGTTMSLLVPLEVDLPTVAPARRRRPTQIRVLIAATSGARTARWTDELAGLGHQIVAVEGIDGMVFTLATEPIDVVVIGAELLASATVVPLEQTPTVVVGDGPGTQGHRSVDDGDGAGL